MKNVGLHFAYKVVRAPSGQAQKWYFLATLLEFYAQDLKKNLTFFSFQHF